MVIRIFPPFFLPSTELIKPCPPRSRELLTSFNLILENSIILQKWFNHFELHYNKNMFYFHPPAPPASMCPVFSLQNFSLFLQVL